MFRSCNSVDLCGSTLILGAGLCSDLLRTGGFLYSSIVSSYSGAILLCNYHLKLLVKKNWIRICRFLAAFMFFLTIIWSFSWFLALIFVWIYGNPVSVCSFCLLNLLKLSISDELSKGVTHLGYSCWTIWFIWNSVFGNYLLSRRKKASI